MKLATRDGKGGRGRDGEKDRLFNIRDAELEVLTRGGEGEGEIRGVGYVDRDVEEGGVRVGRGDEAEGRRGPSGCPLPGGGGEDGESAAATAERKGDAYAEAGEERHGTEKRRRREQKVAKQPWFGYRSVGVGLLRRIKK